MTTIDDVLNQRQQTHGDFNRNAEIAQRLKDVLKSGTNYYDLTYLETEALDMIASKLARIVNSPSYHADNFIDISGYAQLVLANK